MTRHTFLLVESDRDTRELIAAVLKAFGWSVCEASTGEQAKDIVQRDLGLIAAVLCGQALEDRRQDGLKLFREMRSALEPRCIPFVLMVSDPNDAVMRCAQETPMIVVSRPFRIRFLLAFLDRHHGIRMPARVASEL